MKDNRTTIRGIDPEILEHARQIVRDNFDITMGEFMTEALIEYIDQLPFEEE